VRTAVATTAIGVVTMLCAVVGLLYNAQSLVVGLRGGFDDIAREPVMRHFHVVFYLMSGVCIACFLVLLWGGYHLARRRLSVAGVLAVAWLFEIGYLTAIRYISRLSDIGAGIAGAAGVANGGMMAQFFILLPFWGPLAMLWVARRASSDPPDD
jgi:hypothetical protein